MQNQATRIRWNSFFFLLSSAIRLLANFLLFIGIARLYGPEAFGQFTIAHTLSVLFLVLADFGFDSLLTTEIGRHPEKVEEISQRLFSIKFVFALFATMMMIFTPFLLQMSSTTSLLVNIFGVSVLFSSMTNFFFSLFRGLEKFRFEVKISFVVNTIMLCLLFFCGYFHLPLYTFALIFAATRFLGLILAFLSASSLADFKWHRLIFSGLGETWKKVLVFGLLVLFGNLCFQQDTLLLAYWKGDIDVGIYQSVFKLTALTLLIPDISANIFLPVFSRLHAENETKWNALGCLLNKTLIFISLILSTLLFVFAEQIIKLLYSNKGFEGAIPILRIFSITVLIRFAVETYGIMLTTSQRQKRRMYVVALATVFNLFLNIFAVPVYGALGAAYVSLFTNILIGSGYIFSTRSFFSGRMINLKNHLILAYTIIIAVLMWQVRSFPIWYAAPLFVGLNIIVYYFAGYSLEERQLVFDFKHKQKQGKINH